MTDPLAKKMKPILLSLTMRARERLLETDQPSVSITDPGTLLRVVMHRHGQFEIYFKERLIGTQPFDSSKVGLRASKESAS